MTVSEWCYFMTIRIMNQAMGNLEGYNGKKDY